MDKNTGDKISSGCRGLRLSGFIVLWLAVCICAASLVMYMPEIKAFLVSAAEKFADACKNENLIPKDPSAEPDITPGVLITPDTGSAHGGEGSPDGGQQAESFDDSGDMPDMPDMPVFNPSAQENPEKLFEELKEPLLAFCDFLETGAFEYFCKAVPPDCIEFLREKYAGAIFLMGGESNALKMALAKIFTDYEENIGALKTVNFSICEISAADEKELSEIENELRGIGFRQSIEKAYRTKLKFCLEGEKGRADFEHVIRFIKTGSDWFINPGDLIDPKFMP